MAMDPFSRWPPQVESTLMCVDLLEETYAAMEMFASLIFGVGIIQIGL